MDFNMLEDLMLGEQPFIPDFEGIDLSAVFFFNILNQSELQLLNEMDLSVLESSCGSIEPVQCAASKMVLRHRKPKTSVPYEIKCTEKYQKFRETNNQAARLNRQKNKQVSPSVLKPVKTTPAEILENLTISQKLLMGEIACLTQERDSLIQAIMLTQ
jgi:hypothetical protein